MPDPVESASQDPPSSAPTTTEPTPSPSSSSTPTSETGAEIQSESSFANAPAPKPEETPDPAKTEEVAPAAALTLDDVKIDLPEGVSVNDEALGKFLEQANSLKLGKEQAQGLFKMHVEQVESLLKTFADDSVKTWKTTNDGWVKEIHADATLGSGNEEAVQATLGRALDRFGSPKVRQALDMTGAGNHPEVVRFFYNMAKVLDEGTLRPAGQPPAARGPKTLGQGLFPNGIKA